MSDKIGKEIPSSLLRALRSLAASQALAAIDTNDGQRRTKVELLRADADCEPIEGPAQVFEAGDSAVLRVTLEGEPSFVSILATDARGITEAIYPRPADPRERLEPGVVFERCMPLASDRAVAQRRTFPESVRVFASSQPLELDLWLTEMTLDQSRSNPARALGALRLASPSIDTVDFEVSPQHCARWLAGSGKVLPSPMPAASGATALTSGEFAELLGDLDDPQTLREAMESLATRLRSVGYVEQSFYRMPGACGVALVTRLERFRDDGRPHEERFLAPDQESSGFDLLEMIRGLFYATPARYRLLVFGITDRPFSFDVDSRLSAPDGDRLLIGGEMTVPTEAQIVPLDDRFTLAVAVYEFRKEDEDEPAQPVAPGLGLDAHLRGAELSELVGGPRGG